MKAADGTVPSVVEAAIALSLTAPNWEKLIDWSDESKETIRKYRTVQKSTG